MNQITRVAVKVRIARIDDAEIGEKRDQPAAALVDTVADLMDLADLIPGKDTAWIVR
jgi:hypothetical protein